MTHPPPELDALLFLDELVADDASSAPPHPSATSSAFAFGNESHDELLLDSFFDEEPSQSLVSSVQDVAGPPSACSSTASTSRHAPKRKPRRSASYDPNRARNARRHELIYLRGKVIEMETQLKQLQDAAPGDQGHAVAAAQGRIVGKEPRPRGLWEKVATRQREERFRAERENVRLKSVLEAQLKVAKSLETLLYRRAIKGVDECGLANQTRVFATCAKQSDKEIFDELLRQVDACYVQAERVFEELGVGASDSTLRDAKLKDDAEHGVHMEIFASDVLPFALHDTSRAAWQYFSHNKNHMPFRLYYERVGEDRTHTEDTILENCGLELMLNNTKAISRLKQVLRRYVEEDRVVIAFSAIAVPVEFADKPIIGCSFREWGCMILQKSRHYDAEEHTVLKTCYFITPELTQEQLQLRGGNDRDIIGELTEFVLRSTAATMAGWFQLIENILMDEQLGTER